MTTTTANTIEDLKTRGFDYRLQQEYADKKVKYEIICNIIANEIEETFDDKYGKDVRPWNSQKVDEMLEIEEKIENKYGLMHHGLELDEASSALKDWILGLIKDHSLLVDEDTRETILGASKLEKVRIRGKLIEIALQIKSNMF